MRNALRPRAIRRLPRLSLSLSLPASLPPSPVTYSLACVSSRPLLASVAFLRKRVRTYTRQHAVLTFSLSLSRLALARANSWHRRSPLLYDASIACCDRATHASFHFFSFFFLSSLHFSPAFNFLLASFLTLARRSLVRLLMRSLLRTYADVAGRLWRIYANIYDCWF